MLVVRRRAGQTIRIGEEVEIRLMEIGPSRVTLGIVAPREVAVVRGEVQATRQQNLAAAEGPTAAVLERLAGKLRLR